MAEKKKILYIVEAMGGGVFTYIVDLANGFVCTKVEDFVKAIEECQGAVEKLTEHAYQDILKMYNTKVMAEQ